MIEHLTMGNATMVCLVSSQASSQHAAEAFVLIWFSANKQFVLKFGKIVLAEKHV